MTDAEATPLRRATSGDRVDGCHVLGSTRIGYRDGSEDRLFDIMRDATDLGSTSDELIGLARDWPERYHLSPARANVLRPLQLDAGARVLEVGAGCGAITRYLGEQSGQVDALEPVLARARVARARTRDLPGVEVFVGEIDDVPAEPTYDVVVMVGVLEYAAAGSPEPALYRELLDRAAALLTPEGTLVVAIENRLGVKYLVGAPEDHSNRPFDSLEGYPFGSPARTFSRHELTELFAGAGLRPSVYSAFPDYKMSRLVHSEGLFEVDSTLAVRIPQFPSPDWAGGAERVADEAAAWQTLVESGLGPETPNSFLVLASPGRTSDLWPEELLAAYFAIDRRAEFSVATRIVGDGQHEVVFERHRLNGRCADGTDEEDGAATGQVRVMLGRSPWCPGDDLLSVLSRASDTELAGWLDRWVELVDATPIEDDAGPIDLLPHNLVVGPDGQLSVVDSKFVQAGADRETILTRGALVTGQRLAQRTAPLRWGGFTVGAVVQVIGTMIGLPADGSWITPTVAREAEIQRQLSLLAPAARSEEEALRRHADGWWKVLGQPLALASKVRRDSSAVATMEAELGRMGDAYSTMVTVQRQLAEAQQRLVELHRDSSQRVGVQMHELQLEIERLERELAASEHDRAQVRAELVTFEHSISWRLTRPLRAAAGRLRGRHPSATT
ncbi:MAG: methyltransferase [Acidimicrobiales bacterium]